MVLNKFIEEPETRIKNWLKQYKTFRKTPHTSEIKKLESIPLEIQIREAAYYLSLRNFSYDRLCWMLAEKIQKKILSTPLIEDIRKKAEEISKSSKKYYDLCWLNAELEILDKK